MITTIVVNAIGRPAVLLGTPGNDSADECTAVMDCKIDPITGKRVKDPDYWSVKASTGDAGKGEEKAGDAVSNGTNSEDKPSLLDEKGDKHILDGDGPIKGAGHRAATGKPDKSEFPSNWTDDRIRGEISDVATDPNSVRTPQQGGRIKVEGTCGGVDITVIVEPGSKGGRIVTGYPTNTGKNP